MIGQNCCCSSEACRLYGCEIIKHYQGSRTYPGGGAHAPSPVRTGWICPNCGQGVAPTEARCPCITRRVIGVLTLSAPLTTSGNIGPAVFTGSYTQ